MLGDELQTCCFPFRGWEESPAPPRSVRGAQVHSLSEVTGRGQEVFCHMPLNPSGVQHHTWKKLTSWIISKVTFLLQGPVRSTTWLSVHPHRRLLSGPGFRSELVGVKSKGEC